MNDRLNNLPKAKEPKEPTNRLSKTKTKTKEQKPPPKKKKKQEARLRDNVVTMLGQAIRDGSSLERQINDARAIIQQGEPELCRVQGAQDRLWRLLLPKGKTVNEALADNLFGITDAVNGKTPD